MRQSDEVSQSTRPDIEQSMGFSYERCTYIGRMEDGSTCHAFDLKNSSCGAGRGKATPNARVKNVSSKEGLKPKSGAKIFHHKPFSPSTRALQNPSVFRKPVVCLRGLTRRGQSSNGAD